MGLGKKTIDDQNYCGKKVLVRCDFNVPMKDGVITNENRINACLLYTSRRHLHHPLVFIVQVPPVFRRSRVRPHAKPLLVHRQQALIRAAASPVRRQPP